MVDSRSKDPGSLWVHGIVLTPGKKDSGSSLAPGMFWWSLMSPYVILSLVFMHHISQSSSSSRTLATQPVVTQSWLETHNWLDNAAAFKVSVLSSNWGAGSLHLWRPRRSPLRYKYHRNWARTVESRRIQSSENEHRGRSSTTYHRNRYCQEQASKQPLGGIQADYIRRRPIEDIEKQNSGSTTRKTSERDDLYRYIPVSIHIILRTTNPAKIQQNTKSNTYRVKRRKRLDLTLKANTSTTNPRRE